MGTLLGLIHYVTLPLARAATALTQYFAALYHRAPTDGDFAVAAFVVSAALVGFCCVYWACWTQARLSNFRLSVRRDNGRAVALSRFRDLLLEQSFQAIVVLRNGSREPQYFAEGKTLLRGCRSGKAGALLAEAQDTLVECGSSFQLSVPSDSGGSVAIRGVIIGDRAVLFLREENRAEEALNFREILDALPMPVWLRGGNIALEWANGAFLKAVAAESLEDAVAWNAALDVSERGLAAAALASNLPQTARCSAIVAGQSRNFAMNLLPIAGTGVAGIAGDVTEAVRLQSSLNIALATQIDMMERLPIAMAVFDSARALSAYNNAFCKMWDLSEAWLDRHPSHAELLDQLRERRKLPEHRNFAEWKRDQLRPSGGGTVEEFWHLPGGISLRVLTQPHLQGGVFILFEDISERIRLEASLNLLTQVQQATLDTIDEAIAIFGTDGRLILHNALFAQMWLLTEAELIGQPHFLEIAGFCTARIGRDGIWNIVSSGINSTQPERFAEWGKATRADGRSLSLCLSRLPNGATVVTFTDITDLERFETLRNEASNAAA